MWLERTEFWSRVLSIGVPILTGVFGLVVWKAGAKITSIKEAAAKQGSARALDKLKKLKRIEFWFRLVSFGLLIFTALCASVAWRVGVRITAKKEAAAKQELAIAQQLAVKARESQQPRSISAEQEAQFVEMLKDAPKQPLRVIAYSNTRETRDFAKQVRGLLDKTGYRDAVHPVFEGIQGPYLNTPNRESIAICFLGEEKKACALGLRKAFQEAICPTAISYASASMNLQSGEIAVVVLEKYPR